MLSMLVTIGYKTNNSIERNNFFIRIIYNSFNSSIGWWCSSGDEMECYEQSVVSKDILNKNKAI